MTQDLIARIQQLSHPLQPRPTAMVAQLVVRTGIRAVLFDIYGTLVISAAGEIAAGHIATGDITVGDEVEVKKRAFAHAMEAAGFALSDENEVGARAMARYDALVREHHVAGRAAGKSQPEVDVREIWQQLLDEMFEDEQVWPRPSARVSERCAVELEGRLNPVWPMPEAREVLVALRNRGLLLGLVSNAQFYTKLLFPALFGDNLTSLGFDERCCFWSYEWRAAKPGAELYERAAQRLRDVGGIEPAQTLYIGNDMRNDVWAAQKVGWQSVLFAGDERSLRRRKDDERCRMHAPAVIITKLSQVLEIIG